jgi:tRNA dimethylallyltransferase
MDVGTAKPTAAEQKAARHWLIDVLEPDEPFSLGRYLDLAHEALADCWSRDILPILAGGTGQYVWALLEGWQVPRVPPDPALRAELEAIAARNGLEPLVAEIERVDPAYAATVDRRNPRRLIRAIEVYRRTGRPISACRRRAPIDCAWVVVGLECARDELYHRIDSRVDAMIAAGLLDEVRALMERGYGCELPSMSGIGYRQVCEHIAGGLTLAEAVARIKTETHRLARMQGAWFRRDDSRIRWLDITSDDPIPAALHIVESEMR